LSFRACEGRQNDDELDKEDMEEEDDNYIASEEEDDDDDDSGVDECVDLSVTFPPETFCLVTNNVDPKSLDTLTTTTDFQDGHYEDSDDLHTPPESEDEKLGKNYPIFKMGDGTARVKLEKSLKFNNKKQAKAAIEEYALQTRKNLKLKKNEKEYLVVKCMPDCPFHLRISKRSANDFWQVVSFNEDHTCHWTPRNRRAKPNLLAKFFLNTLRHSPEMKVKALKRLAAK